MPTGSIISFKEDRCCGFIRPKDGEDNVYVHHQIHSQILQLLCNIIQRK